MNDEIIQKIKNFKKEEIFRNKKLKNRREKESRTNQKSKNEILNSMDTFQHEISEIHFFYEDVKKADNQSFNNFLSCSDINDYELLEKDLSEVMALNLYKLNEFQKCLSKSENISNYDDLEMEYQTSLYLKHEAKLKEIEAKAELASLEEEIKWLTLNKVEESMFENNLEQDVKNVTAEINNGLKTLFIDESSLEMSKCIECRLSDQTENVEMISELVRLWKNRIARGKIQLLMLDDEKETDENVLDILSSLSTIMTTLTKLEGQLKNTERKICLDSNDMFGCADSQSIVRVKNQLTEVFEPLLTKLDHPGLIVEECKKQKCDHKDLLLELEDKIEDSKSCLENIFINVRDLNLQLINNKAVGVKYSRPSILCEANSEKYTRLSLSSNMLKEKLKGIKEDISNLNIEVEHDLH